MSECPIIFYVTLPKARLVHICCECGDTIEKGSRYEYIKGLWRNCDCTREWRTFHTCLDCSSVRDGLSVELDGDDLVELGNLYGEITANYTAAELDNPELIDSYEEEEFVKRYQRNHQKEDK